jgi:squalene-hopene/tetraprenyl-beta-curcumene cyclase
MSSGINRLLGRIPANVIPATPANVTDADVDLAISADTFAEAVSEAVALTRDYLLDRQQPDGYWVGELEGDTILESEYALLLTYLGQERSETVRRLAAYIAKMQLPGGGWSLYPGGPLEVSGSVKAYWTLKIAGYDIASEPMTRARNAIRAAGGAERVNSFTRYYLALLGIIKYRQCPAVPPELMFIPNWAPFNIYEMSSWSRTILVPLSLL